MITAGTRYTYKGQPVLAMEDAERGIVLVRRIDPSVPVIGMQRAMYVAAERLVPAPMKYHRGAVLGSNVGGNRLAPLDLSMTENHAGRKSG